jgi:hypothetical protein
VRFQVAPQQATLDDEVARKKGGKPAPGPTPANIDEDTMDAARKYAGKLDGKGIGPTGLALVLYGSKTGDRKAAAATICEALVAEGLLIKTESTKGEPVYYPAEK